MANFMEKINKRGYSVEKIKKLVNKSGKKTTPQFEFIEVMKKKKGSHRLIKIKNLQTGEFAIRSVGSFNKIKNPWKRNLGYTNEEMKTLINKVGIKSSPPFKFVSDTNTKDNIGDRLLKVKNLKTGAILTRPIRLLRKGHNPWRLRRYSKEERKKQINDLGKKANPPFVFISEETDKKGKTLMVKVKNLKNGEISTKYRQYLMEGYNPFSKGDLNKLSVTAISKQVNEIGKHSNPQFVFICDTRKKSKYRDRLIKIKNIVSGRIAIKSLSNIKNGANPWRKLGFSEEKIKRQVNTIGRKSTPQFIFVKEVKKINYSRRVKIKNLKTNRVCISYLGNLKKGKNPWNEIQDNHEVLVVQPKVNKYLNNLGLKVKREFNLSKKSKVDFLCTNTKGDVVLIETKSDKQYYSLKKLNTQLNKYETDAIKMFGSKYLKTYLISLKGKHGIPLNNLKSKLMADKFI